MADYASIHASCARVRLVGLLVVLGLQRLSEIIGDRKKATRANARVDALQRDQGRNNGRGQPTPLRTTTMMRQATKKVLVGDAAKRWALTMPPTLAMFRSRVRQVYGLDGRTPFEIWLHPYARGAAPGRGRT